MEFDADDFARLAHELYDQPNVETTLDKIVESAVAVSGCDYAGLLVTSKGHQLVAITATDPAAEKAEIFAHITAVRFQRVPGQAFFHLQVIEKQIQVVVHTATPRV